MSAKVNFVRPVDTETNTNTDAFGRLRVSDPLTTFDSNFASTQQTTRWAQRVTGAGTVTYLSSEATVKLNTVASTASDVTWQTRKYHGYQPGKSLLVLMSGVLLTSVPGTGTVARVGYFDDSNGFFFEYSDANGLNVVRRSTTIGGGDSRVSVAGKFDPTMRQVYFVEMAWLGSATVTMGILRQRGFNALHTFNFLGNTGVYPFIPNPSLPVRWQLTSTTDDTVERQSACICASVVSEGGYNPVGTVHAVSSDYFALGNTNEFACIAIRTQSARNRVTLNPLSFSAITFESGRNYRFRILRLVSPSSAALTAFYSGTAPTFTASASADSGVEVSINHQQVVPSAVTYQIISVSFSTEIDVVVDKLGQVLCTSNVSGDRDVLVIAAQRLDATTGGASNTTVSIQWQEIE